MSGHTPGPWSTDEAEHDCPNQSIRIRGGGRTIAEVWIDDAPVEDYNREQRANARLIAAAPDLYELATYAVDNPNFDSAEFDRMARAAIAKATGGSE